MENQSDFHFWLCIKVLLPKPQNNLVLFLVIANLCVFLRVSVSI